MKSLKTLIGLIFLIGSTYCAARVDDVTQAPSTPHNPEEYWRPPLVAVLANPERFVGKDLTFFGYLEQHYPGQFIAALFISRDHAIYRDYSSSVIVGSTGMNIGELCGGQYVKFSGTFQRIEGVSASQGQMYIIPEPSRVSAIRAGGESTTCWPKLRH